MDSAITLDKLRSIRRTLLANEAPRIGDSFFVPVSRSAAKALHEAAGGAIGPVRRAATARGRKRALRGRHTLFQPYTGSVVEMEIGRIDRFNFITSPLLQTL